MSHSLTAVVVHTQQSHGSATAPVSRPAIDGDWPLHQQDDAAVQAYLAALQVLVAAAYRRVQGKRTLVVIDVRRIIGWTLVEGHRVRFTTAPAPELEHLLGQPSPVRWRAGQNWPVKISHVAPATGPTSAAAA